MGGGTWTASAWSDYSARNVVNKASVDAIYTSKSHHDIVKNGLDPKGVTIRESCDSADNPNSTAIIVALDVTGSMGSVLDVMARKGLPTLAEELYSRKPVTDPHIMFMGVGDVEHDSASLQITQFEADIRIAEQLTKLYLERGGGGNCYESYTLPWYFAALHTKIDCFEKRGKKGYLFTVGDEEPTPYLLAKDIERVLGEKPQKAKLLADEIFTMVSRNYEVFHLIVEQGSHCRFHKDAVVEKWTNLLGQRAILLSDHTKLGEVIISTIQVNEGASKEDVIASWDGSTSIVVAKAVDGIGSIIKADDSGVVKFD